MTSLTGPSRAAASGVADSLVVFLHGYGADGDDLIGLAEPLAPHLPNTRFLAPNAPERCVNNPMGYQWFPIPWLDGTPEAVARASAAAAFAALDGWLDAVAVETPPERTVLVGFSQGTMMALHVGLRRRAPFAGIVGFSGRLLEPELLPGEIVVAAAGAACAWRPGPDGAVREPRRGRAGVEGGRGRGRDACVARRRARHRAGRARAGARVHPGVPRDRSGSSGRMKLRS